MALSNQRNPTFSFPLRRKAAKDSTADPEFVIQKMQKNYGPCQALAPNKPPPASQP
jgi:hypothetical protein